MSFLGLEQNLWSFHRRRVRISDYDMIKSELNRAENALVNALAYSSQGRDRFEPRDRATLTELIDEVRNYIDHINEEY